MIELLNNLGICNQKSERQNQQKQNLKKQKQEQDIELERMETVQSELKKSQQSFRQDQDFVISGKKIQQDILNKQHQTYDINLNTNKSKNIEKGDEYFLKQQFQKHNTLDTYEFIDQIQLKQRQSTILNENFLTQRKNSQNYMVTSDLLSKKEHFTPQIKQLQSSRQSQKSIKDFEWELILENENNKLQYQFELSKNGEQGLILRNEYQEFLEKKHDQYNQKMLQMNENQQQENQKQKIKYKLKHKSIQEAEDEDEQNYERKMLQAKNQNTKEEQNDNQLQNYQKNGNFQKIIPKSAKLFNDQNAKSLEQINSIQNVQSQQNRTEGYFESQHTINNEKLYFQQVENKNKNVAQISRQKLEQFKQELFKEQKFKLKQDVKEKFGNIKIDVIQNQNKKYTYFGYVDEFNLFQYKGVWENKNGDYYFGKFKNSKFHGQGSYFNIEGHLYEGNFRRGYKQQFGLQTYSNNNKFGGNWIKNKKYGLGVFFNNQKNKTYTGEWKNSKIVNYQNIYDCDKFDQEVLLIKDKIQNILQPYQNQEFEQEKNGEEDELIYKNNNFNQNEFIKKEEIQNWENQNLIMQSQSEEENRQFLNQFSCIEGISVEQEGDIELEEDLKIQ
ncbi:hypothetical protein PPERSA_11735 [Pseudocohnilembus persalinus]|uniref:MORN motif n=1 Tax=Pseudocohnilembus persalinus TaxID=266149 RepID=A0A0V0QGM5_PSEPJ|nr:hypothetical protein PPERSA_11735 [Pseudocohnilembus persalinus]|eukprot:KRX01288.1 hypothetical protein PPERSA_11735 [Pseudocohnilembus persalinus]